MGLSIVKPSVRERNFKPAPLLDLLVPAVPTSEGAFVDGPGAASVSMSAATGPVVQLLDDGFTRVSQNSSLAFLLSVMVPFAWCAGLEKCVSQSISQRTTLTALRFLHHFRLK